MAGRQSSGSPARSMGGGGGHWPECSLTCTTIPKGNGTQWWTHCTMKPRSLTLCTISAPLLIDYMILWILIEAVELNPIDQAEDENFGTRSLDGVYSAKAAYDMQFDRSLESSFPAKVWNVWAQSWCRVFIWLMLQNRIWTADRLFHREWINEYFCPLCI
jgi:hypothetical protein